MQPRSAISHPSASALWSFFWLLVRRDLKTRYAGSTLGAVWSLIHPITMILIYMAIFSSLFTDRGGSNPMDYAIHLCSGMLVWLVFSDTLNRGVTALTDNGNFMQKIWFPPLLLHASILFNVLLVQGAGLVALWIILLALGHAAPVSSLLVFPLLLLTGLAAAGMGMAFSALHVFFRDVSQLVMIGLTIGFWFNPIVYPRGMIEKSEIGKWAWFLRLNPVEHFISISQRLFGDPLAAPHSLAWLVVILFPSVSLALGGWVFQRMLPDVRDGL